MEDHNFFDIATLAATLPATAETMLRDLRLVDKPDASCRIFRTYRATPPHYHIGCDEYLYVLQGRAMFTLADEPPREIGPGMLIHFPRNTVHGIPRLLQEPFVVLAIDTPSRAWDDVHFVDSASESARTFIATGPGPEATS